MSDQVRTAFRWVVPALLLLLGARAGAAPLYAASESDFRDDLSNASAGDTIYITQSFNVSGPLVLSEDLIVDGDGFTVTSTGNHPAFRAQAAITLRDIVLHSSHSSGQLVDIEPTGAGSVLSGVRVCGLSGMGTMVRFDADGTIENSVFEAVSGDVISMAEGLLSHVTVQGAGANLNLAASVDVEASALAADPGAASVAGSIVAPAVPEFVDGTNPLCPAGDARPAALGNLWDPAGLHIGGYRADLVGVHQVFTTWNDGDGDGDPYGPAGPEGWDCDDTDPAVGPDADELCNNADDNCDGEGNANPLPTDPQAIAGYVDGDGDGVGSGTPCYVCFTLDKVLECVVDTGDCDDTDPTKVDEVDCDPTDTGPTTPGDDDDDDDATTTPGDDDDVPAPGDDDDGPTEPDPTDDTAPQRGWPPRAVSATRLRPPPGSTACDADADQSAV